MVFTRDYFSNTVLIFNYQLIFEVLRMNKNINKIQNLEYFGRKRKNNYTQKNMEREKSISTEKWVKNEYSTSRCNHVKCNHILPLWIILIHLQTIFLFWTPWKHQKIFGFLVVFRLYEMETLTRKWLNLTP